MKYKFHNLAIITMSAISLTCAAHASDMRPTPEGCAEMIVSDVILVPYSTVGLTNTVQLEGLATLAQQACDGVDQATAVRVVDDVLKELCGKEWPCKRPDLN